MGKLRPLNRLRLAPNEWKRFALALPAGLVLAAAFPKLGVAGLGWLGPGLILASAIGMGGGSAFRIGFVAGLAHWLASLYWLLFIPVAFAPIAGWLLLPLACGPAPPPAIRLTHSMLWACRS